MLEKGCVCHTPAPVASSPPKRPGGLISDWGMGGVPMGQGIPYLVGHTAVRPGNSSGHLGATFCTGPKDEAQMERWQLQPTEYGAQFTVNPWPTRPPLATPASTGHLYLASPRHHAPTCVVSTGPKGVAAGLRQRAGERRCVCCVCPGGAHSGGSVAAPQLAVGQLPWPGLIDFANIFMVSNIFGYLQISHGRYYI